MSQSDTNIADLLARIRELERENAELRSRLRAVTESSPNGKDDRSAEGSVPYQAPQMPETDPVHGYPVPELVGQEGRLNKYSPPQEKIALFRSLFRGREDIFAQRWQSVKSGKSGYTPACGNMWEPGVCPKPNGNCSNCEHRELLPLTDAVIERHLRGRDAWGRDVVGIYPTLPDDTCCFLTLDFDDAGWQENVSLVRALCDRWELPCAVERSRSGAGAHLWLFFGTPVPCADARRLGTALLTAAMESGSTLKLASYDRMFPNQDTLPKGGFGNLIALPLQGQARKRGNSEFVNERYESYPDQWAYLASVPRLSQEKFELICHLRARGSVLGNLLPSSEADGKPWEKKTPVILSPSDFPEELEITKANLLYLPPAGLSAKAKNQLIRLAAFRNPDFFRAQAMRLPIYNKPRVLSTAEDRNGYIALPRGCEDSLTDLLEKAGSSYRIIDKRQTGMPIKVSFTGTLRPEQEPAAEALLRHETGVLSATTAFGKTVVAAYMIGQRKVNTLILVHTQALLNQWKSSLEEFLQIDEILEPLPKKRGCSKKRQLIGQLGGSKNTLSGIVDIAILQSLLSGDAVNELVKNYGMVIVDECHHVSAFSFERILKEVNAKYVYGLSATPTRADGHQPIVFLQCGPIRYSVDAKEQAKKRGFTQYVIPRFTAYRTAAEERGIAALYSDLAENEKRNRMIVQDVKAALAQGRNPILLTERREHVHRLASLLSGTCPNIISLFGTASSRLRRETMEQLMRIPADAPLIVIATGRYVGEGFDCPRLDTLFLTLPVAWKGTVAQYAGRLHRSYPGKDEVQIYDYVDVHVPVLEAMYQKRIKAYAAIGYHIKTDGEKRLSRDLIYDSKNYYPVFCQDLQNAEREILIVSPYMAKSRLQPLARVLTEPILHGVTVKVVTLPAENLPARARNTFAENVRLIEGYGVHVVFCTDLRQKFAVIDGSISWYGSVSMLGFNKADESVMRLESAEIAGELIDTVTQSKP